jgi:hypothetical protein
MLMDSSSSSSDEEETLFWQIILNRHQSSIAQGPTPKLTRRARLDRDRVMSGKQLMEYYFGENPNCLEDDFHRRYRMSR